MGEADWKSGFNTTLLPEVIWGSNVISTETTFFRSYFYLASNTFNGSQVRNNPKIADKRLYAQIPDTDYRKDMFLKMHLIQVLLQRMDWVDGPIIPTLCIPLKKNLKLK